jgi:hypothetical protein
MRGRVKLLSRGESERQMYGAPPFAFFLLNAGCCSAGRRLLHFPRNPLIVFCMFREIYISAPLLSGSLPGLLRLLVR